MNKVALIFRKKNDRFYSIEKVFEPILLRLKNEFSISCLIAPNFSSGISSIARNILYFKNFISAADIFHITGDIHYVTIALPKKRTILTIHDLVFMQQTKGLKRLIFKWLYIDLPVMRSARVTTISDKSKQELLRYAKCKPDKIIVIPNAVSDNFYFSEYVFNNNQPRILFIGTTSNKNLERVAEAISGVACLLRIIGKPSIEQVDTLIKYNINYSYKFALSDQEMALEYADSDIILFPSLYEGFGMPIIEGQKSGRPVITSNLSPLKEVAGNGACLVDPLDSNSIRSGLTKVIECSDYRKELIHQGRINVQKYTPDHIASLYTKVYASLINRDIDK